jgi:hypothetical protein
MSWVILMKNQKKYTSMEWKEIKQIFAKAQKRKLDFNASKRLTALHMRGLGKSNKIPWCIMLLFYCSTPVLEA